MSPAQPSRGNPEKAPGALAWRLVLLAVTWAVLAEGDEKVLWVGLLAVPLAAWVGLRLRPSPDAQVRPVRLLRFVPFFAWQSLAGSIDVARRALRPGRTLAPGWMEVHSRLPSVTARLFFAGMVTLAPGTLVAKVEGERFFLHVLDASLAGRAAGLRGLRALESEVAFLFGLRLRGRRP